MGVAAAIIGSAAIGALASAHAGHEAKQATHDAANKASLATTDATQSQLAEIQRQFNYQQALLQPFVQNQYRAQARYANLLAFGNQPAPQVPSLPAQLRASGRPAPEISGPMPSGNTVMPAVVGYGPRTDGQPMLPSGQPADQGAGHPFYDPNLDNTRLAAPTGRQSELGQQVFSTPLAGATPDQDLDIQRANDVRLAAPGGYTQDPRFQFAHNTETVGDSFTQSPGYQFELEQGMKALANKNSAGGNYGGAALKEAQRYATGLAQQDYYNYLAARRADLARQDQAIGAYQNQQAVDVGRGDQALQSYFGRRAGDLARQDQAIASNTALKQQDLERQRQGYYNYLASLGEAAGLNVGVPQALGSSAAAGAAATNAYGQQGGTLANLYNQAGINRAITGLGTAANINNTLQQGFQNYLTYKYAGLGAG